MVTKARHMTSEHDLLVRYRQLFEHMSSCVAVYKPVKNGQDFIFTDFNKAAERSEHMKRDELIGKSLLHLFPKVKEFGLFKVLKRVNRTGKPEVFPIAFYKDQRISGWRENYIYKLPSGEIVAIYDDLTEKKQAEFEIERREARLKSIFAGAQDGIIEVDFNEKKIISVNKSFCQLTGYSKKYLLSTKIVSKSAKDSMGYFLYHLIRQYKKTKKYSGVFIKTKNGNKKYCDIYTDELLEGDKKNYILVFHDVTAQHNEKERLYQHKVLLEKRVQERTAELEKSNLKLKKSTQLLIQTEKMSILGLFAAGIAHELNNPMTGILNYIQYSLKHTEPKDRRYVVLKNAENELQRCGQILRNLLSFARMDVEGKEKFCKADIHEIIDNVMQLLTYRLRAENIKIIKKYSSRVPLINLKANKIQQVILNLLLNAIDAVKKSKEKKIIIQTKRIGETIELSFTDTGVGIAKNVRDRIFEPFFTTKQVSKGLGIGLVVVKHIIIEHKGLVSFRSRIHQGTTFTIKLPLK